MWWDLLQCNFGNFGNSGVAGPSAACQNTIDSIHATLTRTETDTSGVGAGTLNMKLSVHDAELEVRRVWDRLMGDAAEADRARGQLGALRRLQWALQAPNSVRKELQRGDVRAAAAQYRRRGDAAGAGRSLMWRVPCGETLSRVGWPALTRTLGWLAANEAAAGGGAAGVADLSGAAEDPVGGAGIRQGPQDHVSLTVDG
eukprot:9148647-Pyramimonas_sp.AAC.1